MSKNSIGFVGLGNMGSRIARCLVQGGKQVVGSDPVTENILAAGATAAASPAAVLADCRIVFLSLPDSKVVEHVIYADDGLLSTISQGDVVIDLSTAAPESTRRISSDFAARGAHFLDAGISGGAAAAERGALTLMVGGDEQVLDECRELLTLIATQVHYLGASGSGHTTKLLNNFLNAVALAATAEAMVAAKKAGLDLHTVLDVFNQSSGVNFATQQRFPHIIEGDYLEGGLTNTLMLKDLTLYADMVTQLGVLSLNSSGPISSFGLARSLGYADRISNTVVDAIGDLSGGVRLDSAKESA